MRNENEKKSVTKSIKMSPQQEQQIREQAEQKGMNFSEYMLDCALHGNQGITPYMAVKMQEIWYLKLRTVLMKEIIYIRRN